MVRAAGAGKLRRRAVLTSGRWTHRGTAAPSRATLRSVHLEIIVGLPDLVHLLKAHGTENGCEELHRRVSLRSAHLLEADSAARNHTGREVRPSRPLLRIVKCVYDLLPLLGAERSEEFVGCADDLRSLGLRQN